MTATLATASTGAEVIPGDPDEVDGLGARLALLGDGLSEAAARLVDLDDGDWQGPASDAFRRALGDQPGAYTRAGEAFGAATAGLRRFADVLRTAQADAQRAVEQYREAEASSAAWRRSRDAHEAEVARLESSTDPAVVTSAATVAGPSPTDPGAVGRERALAAVDTARARVDDEAAAAAAVLAAAEEGAPDEPGFWSSLWGGASELVGGLWDSTGGAVVETAGAMLEDLDGFVGDVWDNLYDHVAIWNWDTFWGTWWADVKDLVAWEDWAAGNPWRAIGRIAGSLVLGLGAGKLVLRLLRRRGDGGSSPGDGTEPVAPGARTPEQNRQAVRPFDGAPGYDRIHRSDRSDRHILGGERYGNGGHRPGTGFPGKTEFPDGWSDTRILDAVDGAVQNPVKAWRRRDFGNGNTNFTYVGEADGLRIGVVVDRDGRVISAFPEEGQPGVYLNPSKPPAPPGASRPVWTREDATAGADGYWTWQDPGGVPVRTDRGGRPLAAGGPEAPPPSEAPPPTVPPGEGGN